MSEGMKRAAARQAINIKPEKHYFTGVIWESSTNPRGARVAKSL